MIRLMKGILLGIILLLPSKGVHAAGAHVHGQAYLSIALDGQNLVIYLVTTAHDVVGFEHMSGHKEEYAQVEAAIDSLKTVEDWLIPDAGGCVTQSVEVNSPFAITQSEHADHSDHNHHADHTDHTGSGHADFEVTAEYACQTPDELSGVLVRLIDLYTEIHQIEVQWLVHNRQGLLNLSSDDNEVRFR